MLYILYAAGIVMFELTVKVNNFTNTLSHAKLKVSDLSSGKSYVVSFSKYRVRGLTPTFNSEEENIMCCQPSTVKLYSHSPKTLDNFIKDYESQFGKVEEKKFFIALQERRMKFIVGKNFNILNVN